jgi:copper(I)-binding protein
MNRIQRPVGVAGAALITSLIAGRLFAAGETITVEHAMAPASLPGTSTGVIYLTLHNLGTTPDRLVAAMTPAAAKVEIHSMTMAAGSTMQMRPLTDVAVAVGQSVEFKSGGLHLMLVGLRQPLNAGESIPLVLKFEKAGTITTAVPVLGR